MSRDTHIKKIKAGDPVLDWALLKSITSSESQIVETGSFSGIYSLDNLTAHFKIFREELSRNTHLKTPIIFILANSDHSISVGFDPIKKTWSCGHKKEVAIEMDTDAQTAWTVKEIFKKNKGTNVSFSSTLYTTEAQHDTLSTTFEKIESNAQWQEIHSKVEKTSISEEEKTLDALKEKIIKILKKEKQSQFWSTDMPIPDKEKLIIAIKLSVNPDEIANHITAYKEKKGDSLVLKECIQLLSSKSKSQSTL